MSLEELSQYHIYSKHFTSEPIHPHFLQVQHKRASLVLRVLPSAPLLQEGIRPHAKAGLILALEPGKRRRERNA